MADDKSRLDGESSKRSETAPITNLIVASPRWLLLVALVFAPWAYGCTRPWTMDVLNIIVGTVIFLWLLSCALRRSWPVIHPVLAVASGLLLLQSWWMVLNARFDYDTKAYQYIALHPWLSWAPGTMHKSISLPMAIHITVLLGAACFCADLARRPSWRKRLLLTMALTGVSIIIFGLVQRVSGAEGIFWGAADQGETFFATYRYHANAGAFINIIWPLVTVFLLAAYRKAADRRIQIFWAAALILSLAGVFVNASRGANLIALALVGLWLGCLLWKKRSANAVIPRVQFERSAPQSLLGSAGSPALARELVPASTEDSRKSRRRPNPAAPILILLAVIMALAGLAALGGLDTSLRRWGKFNQELSGQNPRLIVAQVCARMLPDAGCWGFGPGTFQTVFPYYTGELGEEIRGVWLFAHDDYLQTLVEWGWLGSALWAVILLGGIVFSWLLLARNRLPVSATDKLHSLGIWIALIGVFVHAGMDFPLQIASIQLYAAVLLGILWSCRTWISKPDPLGRLKTRLKIEKLG